MTRSCEGLNELVDPLKGGAGEGKMDPERDKYGPKGAVLERRKRKKKKKKEKKETTMVLNIYLGATPVLQYW